MDSQSQQSEDFSLSPSMFSSQPFFPYTTTPNVSMPFSVPPHSFSAMLTSSLPGSPVLFRPPNLHGLPLPQTLCDTMASVDNAMQPKKGGKQAARPEGDVKASVPKKAKGRKGKSVKKDLEDDGAERDSAGLWKDYWVEHLVHIRGGMNEEFNKPPKQGVDLWSKVSTKLAGMFSDYDKDSEACRKKWARVTRLYREDKAHNAISGNDRKRPCKWYDVVDEYMHDRANVVCKSHASALEESPVDASNLDKDKALEGVNTGHGGRSTPSTASTAATKGSRRTHVLDESFAELADSGRELVVHLKEASGRREAQQDRALDIFQALHNTMAAFLEHAQRE